MRQARKLVPTLELLFICFVLAGSTNSTVRADDVSLTRAPTLPDGFIERVIARGLDRPIAFDIADDGRIFVTEKSGRIRVIENDVLKATPFLDISARVNSRGERGLLGIALHPDFPNRPFVYVSYTYDPPEAGTRRGNQGRDGDGNRVARVSRFKALSSKQYNVTSPASEVVVFGRRGSWTMIGNPAASGGPQFSCQSPSGPVDDCIPHDSTNHAIGSMKFGADGSLYVSIGDGSAGGSVLDPPAMRAQDVNSPLGKVLRLNPASGEGYSDNPYYDGNPNSNRSKVWYLGFRNPFRFALRKTDDRIFVGNVGQSSYEEIESGEPGANFGWPCYEGGSGSLIRHGRFRNHAVCQSLYDNPSTVIPPTYAYRNIIGAAVVVGDFTPLKWPGRYRHSLFFADHNNRSLKYLRFNRAGKLLHVDDFGISPGRVTQMYTAKNNGMYYSDLIGGQIKVLRHLTTNSAPEASFKAAPVAGVTPLRVRFDARNTLDIDGDLVSYHWRFGDGSTGKGVRVSHTYQSEGNYVVRLTAQDEFGKRDHTRFRIIAGNAIPKIGFRKRSKQLLAETRFSVGERVTVSGWARDQEDGVLASERLQWTSILHHGNHEHPDLGQGIGPSFSFEFPDHGDNTWVVICLRATDSAGLQAKTCREARPKLVTIRVDSRPQGRRIDYAGRTRRTPFNVTSNVGGVRTLSAPETSGDGLRFKRWSNGGAASHSIRVPDTQVTYRAHFER